MTWKSTVNPTTWTDESPNPAQSIVRLRFAVQITKRLISRLCVEAAACMFEACSRYHLASYGPVGSGSVIDPTEVGDPGEYPWDQLQVLANAPGWIDKGPRVRSSPRGLWRSAEDGTTYRQ